MSRNLLAVVLSGGDVSPSRGEFKNAVHRNSRQCSWGPAALARRAETVCPVGRPVVTGSAEVLVWRAGWVTGGVKPLQVGLVADPAKPTQIARRFGDLHPSDGEDLREWDLEVVSEPFTVACEDVDCAVAPD